MEHRLQGECLFVPPALRCIQRLVHRLRPMHAPQRGAEVLDPALLAQERGDRVIERGRGRLVQCGPDDAAEGRGLDALDGPIDGNRCRGGEGLIGLGALRDLPVRGQDGGAAQLQPAAVVLDPRSHEQPAARLEGLHEPLLIEEDRVRHSAVVVRDGDGCELPLAVLHAARADVDDRHVEDDVLALRQPGQSADVREGAGIDPPVRQVPQQSVEVADASRRERLRAAPGRTGEDRRAGGLLAVRGLSRLLHRRVTQRRPPATSWTDRPG